MRIVETIDLVNADKVVFGARVLKLELDTDTNRVTIDAPAMFVNPIVPMDELQEKLMALADMARGQ